MNESDRKRLIELYFLGEGGNSSLLLMGKKSYAELKLLFDFAISHTVGNVKWFESLKNPADFWERFMQGLNIPLDNIKVLKEKFSEGHDIFGTLEDRLKNLDQNYHVFIPEIDSLFYKFDTMHGNNLFNARLRSLWQHYQSLYIYASTSMKSKRKYLATLGKHSFPFYAGNFNIYNADI